MIFQLNDIIILLNRISKTRFVIPQNGINTLGKGNWAFLSPVLLLRGNLCLLLKANGQMGTGSPATPTFCIQQIVLHASFWFPSPSRCNIPPEGISKRLISREVAAWKLGLLFSQQMNISNGLMDLHSRPLVGSRRKNLWYDLRPFLWSLARSDVQGSSPRLWGVLISFAWPVRLPLCYVCLSVTPPPELLLKARPIEK